MALISNLAKWRVLAVQAHCAESSARRRRTSRKFNIPTSGTRAVPTYRVSNDAAQLKFGDEELGSNQSVKRRAGAATLTLRPAHVKTTARRRAVQRRSGREEREVHPLCWNGQSPGYQGMNVQCRHSLLLATSQRFQFIERSRPVGSEKPRQATVSQHFAAGLTTGAVVGLVIGIAKALDLLATARAG